MTPTEQDFKEAYQMMVKGDSFVDEKQELGKLLMKSVDTLTKDEIKRISYLQNKINDKPNKNND